MVKEYGVNYSDLQDTLTKKPIYKLADVKDRIESVAFDVVRFKSNDDGANLWKIEADTDGDYIVSLYDEELVKKEANVWEVVLSKTAADLHIFYKGDPIVKVAVKSLGIPASEVSSLPRYLPNKLALNKRLVSSLLSELSKEAKKAVISKYPELIS